MKFALYRIVGEMELLTPERARELSEQLEAARKESEAIRAHLEEYRRRARVFWPERRRNVVPFEPSPDGGSGESA